MKRLFSGISIVAIALVLCAVPALAQEVPDFTKFGFPTVAASQQVAAGAAATVSANVTGGTVSIEIPAGAFTNAVKFEIITGPISNFLAKAPSDDMPEMDFALRVTDMTTNQLIGTFQKPVQMTARASTLTADSSFYNIDTAGNFDENPMGIQTAAGVMMHPIPIATVGWVLTTPKSEVQRLPATGGSGMALWRSYLAGAAVLAVLVVSALLGLKRRPTV